MTLTFLLLQHRILLLLIIVVVLDKKGRGSRLRLLLLLPVEDSPMAFYCAVAVTPDWVHLLSTWLLHKQLLIVSRQLRAHSS